MPLPLSDVLLVDQDGKTFSLSSYKGRPVLVDFMYTRCPTLCGVLGDDFHDVLQLMSGAGAGAPIDLLSISFDPAYDTPTVLRKYAQGEKADPGIWKFATGTAE